jgi:hypothetical protein
MSTPKDKERIAAFRAWYRWAERQPEPIDIDLNPRTVERMLRGSRKAPPPKLLEELAGKCTDTRLRCHLLTAAAPAGADPAPTESRNLIDELTESTNA